MGAERGKVRFTKEKETLLITLYARAVDSRSKAPVLGDPWAEGVMEQIDYDFGKLKVGGLQALSIAIRAKNFDLWTTRYLAAHPDATVLHLGCGLDSRAFRIDPPPGVPWYDLDYPEVIELRRRLYPERAGYRMIGTSLADLSWLDGVPADRPAMIVAEGVMMYLTDEIATPLLRRLTDRFPSGQMAFDAFNRLGRRTARADRNVSATGASFGWSLDDPQDVKQVAPRMELIREFRTSDFVGSSRMPWGLWAVARVMESFTVLRRMNRALLYQF